MVTDVQLVPGSALESAQVLSLAAALERESSHPIARAITEAANRTGECLPARVISALHAQRWEIRAKEEIIIVLQVDS